MNRTLSFRRLRGAVVLALVTSQLVGCGMASADMGASSPSSGPMRLSGNAKKAEESMFGGVADMEAPQAQYAQAAPAQMPMEPPAPPPPPPPPPPGMPRPEPAPSPDGPAAPAGVNAQRADAIVIYTAELVLSVFEIQKSLEDVAAVARTNGGFMARRDDRSITIRVPARRFDEAVKQLEGIGDVLHRNVVAEDVSEEFHDLQIQLRNLQAMRERLVVLLGKANKVEEAIAVERELGRVAGEIDRIQGRLKFLADRAALSTITVRFEPRAPENVQKGPFVVPLPWLHDLGIDRLINL